MKKCGISGMRKFGSSNPGTVFYFLNSKFYFLNSGVGFNTT